MKKDCHVYANKRHAGISNIEEYLKYFIKVLKL